MFDVSTPDLIKQKAIESGKWALIARVSQVFGGASLLVILPFWLTPDDFGIITMLTSVLALSMILQQAGFAEATIQGSENVETFRDTAFWLNFLISTLLYCMLYLMSPSISVFFQDLRLMVPLRVAGLQIVFAGMSNIPMAWLQRAFKFKSFALIHLVSSLIMIFLTLLLAGRGLGYWAYIAGILGAAIGRLILVLVLSDWFPRTYYDGIQVLRLLRFSGFVLLEMILGWLLVWFDNVVVARHLGSQAAGIYSLAFNMAGLAISLPCSGITGMTLPIFSRLQNDVVALRSAYLKGTSLISAYTIPASVGISLVGAWIVRIIYPEQWKDLGSILSILALYSGFGYLWILNTDAFKAIGKPEIMVKIYVIATVVMLPLYWWSSQIGLVEFTIARSLVVLIGALPHTIYAVRYLQLKKDYLWQLIRTPLLATIVMVICVGGGEILFQQLIHGVMGLLIITGLVVVGVLTYVAVLWKLSPEFVRNFYNLFLQLTRQAIV